MNAAKNSSSLSLACAGGHVVFRNGQIVCGRSGCNCGIPINQFVNELVRSGGLSLDSVFKQSAERYYHMPQTMRRVVTVDPDPKPLEIKESDIAALERRYVAHRTHNTHYLSEYVKHFVIHAPERLEQMMIPGDWDILCKGDDIGMRSFLSDRDTLQRLRSLNPTAVDRWIGEMDEQERKYQETLPEHLNSARTGRDLYDVKAEEKAYHCAFSMLWVVGRAKVHDPERAITLLSEEDRASVERALDWLQTRKSTWNTVNWVYTLYAVDPSRARELIQTLWPRLKQDLQKWGKKTRNMLRRQIRCDISTNGWDGIYFGDLRSLHKMRPDLAAEVSDARDWRLVTEQLEVFRARPETDVYHVAHLTRMRDMEPLYTRLWQQAA